MACSVMSHLFFYRPQHGSDLLANTQNRVSTLANPNIPGPKEEFTFRYWDMGFFFVVYRFR